MKAGIKLSEIAQAIERRDNSYVAIDLETTGLDPKHDKIIEIGAVKVVDGKIMEEFSSFVNPRRKLEECTTKLTGITGGMLTDAPGAECLIESVIDFCGDFPILGHHIIFDYSFLKRAAVNCGLKFEKNGIDTLIICRKFMPEGEKKNLMSAGAYYGIVPETAHRALSDARMAHFLYQAVKSQHFQTNPEAFFGRPLIYKVKKEQPATKNQKEGLRELIKYHKINLSVQIEYLTRNEASRMTDKIISQYGRIKRGEKNV